MIDGWPRGSCDCKRRFVKGTGVIIDWCPRCEGIWFDGGELERSFAAADQQIEIPHEALAGAFRCPLGHGPLRSFHYPDTLAMIEMCEHCFGIWLDGGQFREIRIVREHRAAEAEMKQREGVRGAICDWIDAKIAELSED
jgi:Zn-finger nucleic acid-binding protein